MIGREPNQDAPKRSVPVTLLPYSEVGSARRPGTQDRCRLKNVGALVLVTKKVKIKRRLFFRRQPFPSRRIHVNWAELRRKVKRVLVVRDLNLDTEVDGKRIKVG